MNRLYTLWVLAIYLSERLSKRNVSYRRNYTPLAMRGEYVCNIRFDTKTKEYNLKLLKGR